MRLGPTALLVGCGSPARLERGGSVAACAGPQLNARHEDALPGGSSEAGPNPVHPTANQRLEPPPYALGPERWPRRMAILGLARARSRPAAAATYAMTRPGAGVMFGCGTTGIAFPAELWTQAPRGHARGGDNYGP